MTICNFLDDHGGPPRNCNAFDQWITELLTDLENVDSHRCCGGPTSTPTDADLNACFDPCPVPSPAMITWIDTTDPLNPTVSLWVRCLPDTENDSDGDGIVDREWKDLSASACTCNVIYTETVPAANNTGLGVPFPPQLLDAALHRLVVTPVNGGPLICLVSGSVLVRFPDTDNPVATSDASAQLMVNGVATGGDETTINTNCRFSALKNQPVGQDGSRPFYFSQHGYSAPSAAPTTFEIWIALARNGAAGRTPNTSTIELRRNASWTNWTVFELCCTGGA